MHNTLKEIQEKYRALGENPDTYLEGLLQTEPLTYWDYIQVDTLLSLQKPRTGFADEKIFIIYHQITELMQELVLHELRQITGPQEVGKEVLAEKVSRINRYTRMLITSFDVMRHGMDYDDYNTFRKALAPASGFQSVSFRYIELYCTPVINLINVSGRERLPQNPSLKDCFEHIYWKDAGLNRKTGEETATLHLFREKYENELLQMARQLRGHTLADKIQKLSLDDDTRGLLREFDRLYNIEWPLVHLRTAAHYLDAKGENKAATGGSEWKKYLHPAYQQRKFFPGLWSHKEIAHWAKNYNL